MKIERERYLEKLVNLKDNGKVKIITGIRRSGKSYLLKELYKDFSSVERGIKLEFLGGHFKLTTKEDLLLFEKIIKD